MIKYILSGLLLGMSVAPAIAGEDKITRGYNTMDAMGCMLLRECTDDVQEVFSLLDVSSQYPNTEEFTPQSKEFNTLLVTLNQIGIKVFLADERYFPHEHRGVYHTVSNNFYLNKRYMDTPASLMMVMRHEGWHAAQDCMAGTIDNSLIAIIMPEDSVPPIWREMVEKTYPKSAWPWEAEASWAGKTEAMTADALNACAAGQMWTEYPPTPLTREYLVKEGYIQ